MIDDPPLLTLRKDFPRPSAQDVKALQDVPTGFAVDAMFGRGALDYRIKPLDRAHMSFVGCVVTCRTGPDDNLGLLGALEVAQTGDVIIAATDSYSHSAVTGDLVLGMARNIGVVGFVTDGLIRDAVGIRALQMPVFSRGITPNSPVRNGPGSVGEPIQVGGVHVQSGDIAIGDEDGVVIIPLAQVSVVLSKLPAIRVAEAELDQKVKDGLQRAAFLEELYASGKIQEIKSK